MDNSSPPSEGRPLRLPEGIKLPDGAIWEGHQVNIDRFEGPLDLLLFLVREKKIPITEISISDITNEFLAYVKALEELDDLDTIGDFLVMAATMIQIKTRELLPSEDAAEIEDAEMTRDDLIRLLLEYERFKAAASSLEGKMRERSRVFIRNRPSFEPEQEEILKVDLTKLLEAFRGVLRRAPADEVKELVRETIRIEDRSRAISEQLERTGSILFSELFSPTDSKRMVVATFLALLDLMRSEDIVVVQSDILGEIRLVLKTG